MSETKPDNLISAIAIKSNLENLKKYAVKSIVKNMRSLGLTEFHGMHDMLLREDAWILPVNIDFEPIKLSEIKSIDSLILIIDLLCNSQKLDSSIKLSVYENIVKKQEVINSLV